jgi:hypothetical protein
VAVLLCIGGCGDVNKQIIVISRSLKVTEGWKSYCAHLWRLCRMSLSLLYVLLCLNRGEQLAYIGTEPFIPEYSGENICCVNYTS